MSVCSLYLEFYHFSTSSNKYLDMNGSQTLWIFSCKIFTVIIYNFPTFSFYTFSNNIPQLFSIEAEEFSCYVSDARTEKNGAHFEVPIIDNFLTGKFRCEDGNIYNIEKDRKSTSFFCYLNISDILYFFTLKGKSGV